MSLLRIESSLQLIKYLMFNNTSYLYYMGF